jgi:hypothetical protein
MRAAHIAAAAVTAVLFASFASAQGLGDAAAREKEKRKAEAKPSNVKVYTESDLGKSPVPSSSPLDLPTEEEAAADGASAEGGDSGAEAQAGGAAPSAQADEKARAEEAWRKKIDQARKEEQVYQEVIDKLQLELNDMSGGVYNPGRAARINFLEENKQLLAQTQEKVATLEAEGRANGYQ